MAGLADRRTVLNATCNGILVDASKQPSDKSGRQGVEIAAFTCDYVGAKAQHCPVAFGETHRESLGGNDNAKVW
jgi:hypothetical protein